MTLGRDLQLIPPPHCSTVYPRHLVSAPQPTPTGLPCSDCATPKWRRPPAAYLLTTHYFATVPTQALLIFDTRDRLTTSSVAAHAHTLSRLHPRPRRSTRCTHHSPHRNTSLRLHTISPHLASLFFHIIPTLTTPNSKIEHKSSRTIFST